LRGPAHRATIREVDALVLAGLLEASYEGFGLGCGTAAVAPSARLGEVAALVLKHWSLFGVGHAGFGLGIGQGVEVDGLGGVGGLVAVGGRVGLGAEVGHGLLGAELGQSVEGSGFDLAVALVGFRVFRVWLDVGCGGYGSALPLVVLHGCLHSIGHGNSIHASIVQDSNLRPFESKLTLLHPPNFPQKGSKLTSSLPYGLWRNFLAISVLLNKIDELSDHVSFVSSEALSLGVCFWVVSGEIPGDPDPDLTVSVDSDLFLLDAKVACVEVELLVAFKCREEDVE
jgi:hypothetical protein